MDAGLLLPYFEFFIILAFGLGWAVLELYTSRLDKRKREREEAAARAADTTSRGGSDELPSR